MIHPINAKTKISQIDDECIQPNAIDLRVLSISQIVSGRVELIDNERQHLDLEVIYPTSNQPNTYYLDPGIYSITFRGEIEVAEGEAGIIVQRSTLNRNGITITSGLYDSGYKGIIGGCLHIPAGVHLVIGENERLAQFIIFISDSIAVYNGVYNSKA